MSVLILPRRFTSQPQSVVSLDSKGLGSKVRFALLGNNLRELRNGIARTGTQGVHKVTPAGIAYTLPATASTWVGQLDEIGTDKSITINWYGYLVSNTSQSLLNVNDGTYGWDMYTGAWAPGSLSVGYSSKWRGSSRSKLATISDNSLHSITVVCDSVALVVEVFLDGVSLAAPDWILLDGAMSGTQTWSMTASAASPHSMLALQVYTGKLAVPEIRQLAANPWSFLKVSPSRLWGASVAGGTITLVTSNSTQANTASTPTIEQTHSLAVNNCAQGNAGASTTVAQTHILSVNNSTESNLSSSSAITIGSDISIAVSAAVQANSASTVAVTQIHVLIVAPSSESNLSASGALTQVHILTVSSSGQGNLSTTSIIVQVYILAVSNVLQLNFSLAAALSGTSYFAFSCIQVNYSSSSAITMSMNSNWQKDSIAEINPWTKDISVTNPWSH